MLIEHLPTVPDPQPGDVRSSRRSEWSRFAANLGGGLKALLWWRVPRADFDDSPAQLCWLFVVNLGLAILHSRFTVAGEADFYLPSVYTIGFGMVVQLGIGLGYAGPHAPRAARLGPFVAALCVAPWLQVMSIAIAAIVAQLLTPEQFAGLLRKSATAVRHGSSLSYWLMSAYVSLAMLRVIWVRGGVARWRIAIAAAGLLAMAMLPQLVTAHRFYYPHYDSTEKSQSVEERRDEALQAIASEELLDLQPQLMQRAMAALKPQRPGVVDAYFIGFAPDAEQDVFLRELRSVHQLMDQRFDTAGRSIVLANSADSMRTLPIASMANLRRALRAVGQRMNEREDVLILYLTSHGGRDGSLYSSMGPLQLTEVTPDGLKAALDEAGIGTRVIAVSACYAGTYIEPLRNPSALVMTAADAKHTSFGCSNEADFTYFGKAVFDEALRHSFSFTEAFAKAVPVLREREAKVSHDFSNPQIVVGERAKATLMRLQARLEKQASSSR